MIPVYQTTFSDEATGVKGNCFWAAVSTITGIPLDRFSGLQDMSEGTWFPPLWDILSEYGFTYLGMYLDKKSILSYNVGVDGYYIVAGGSPRGCKHGHAVVFKEGVMVHDPHPDGTGITGINYAVMIERKNND